MKKINANRGFTLIELLVVLAIIGILIALAIIGLRGAQGAQRDTARKDIVATLNANIQQYLSNGNTAPASISGSTSSLIPSGGSAADCATSGSTGNNNGYKVNGICIGTDGLTIKSGTNGVQSCGAATPTITTTDVNLCYDQGTSYSAGYRLGVFLEGGSTYYATN